MLEQAGAAPLCDQEKSWKIQGDEVQWNSGWSSVPRKWHNGEAAG